MPRGLASIRRLGLLAALAWPVGACGSSSAPVGAASDAFTTCSTEARAMPYRAGMEVRSATGTFTVKLLDSDPAPPVKGNDVWTIEVDDANAAPVDALDISATPWMPDHGHGTEPVVVTAQGLGKYRLAPLYLYMHAYWEIRLGIASGSGASAAIEDAMIPICIP